MYYVQAFLGSFDVKCQLFIGSITNHLTLHFSHSADRKIKIQSLVSFDRITSFSRGFRTPALVHSCGYYYSIYVISNRQILEIAALP